MISINAICSQPVMRPIKLPGGSDNLKLQLPLIAKEFPEVGDCFHGIINLQLGCVLVLLPPDHRTQPIKWSENDESEVFDFLRIKIEAPRDTPPVPAWLYVAHGSQWRQYPHIHEVIASQLSAKIDEDLPIGIALAPVAVAVGAYALEIIDGGIIIMEPVYQGAW